MATLLSGKEVSLQVQNSIRQRVEILKTCHNVTPLLAIVQVGNREDSNVYIRAKIKMAQDVGMLAELHRLTPETTEKEVSYNYKLLIINRKSLLICSFYSFHHHHQHQCIWKLTASG